MHVISVKSSFTIIFQTTKKIRTGNFAIIVTKTYLVGVLFSFFQDVVISRNMRNLLLLTAVAVIFLTFVNGEEELLGAQKCTWGPSYWCQGIRESSQCSATKHCIRKYWNSNPYPEDDDDVCKICKEMVKEARDQLKSNQTQVSQQVLFAEI